MIHYHVWHAGYPSKGLCWEMQRWWGQAKTQDPTYIMQNDIIRKHLVYETNKNLDNLINEGLGKWYELHLAFLILPSPVTNMLSAELCKLGCGAFLKRLGLFLEAFLSSMVGQAQAQATYDLYF